MVRARAHLWWGLFASSHPGPTLVVTSLAGVLAAAAGLSLGRIALLAAVVFLGQLSVGLSNDALDLRRDRAVGRTDKPLVRGDLSLRSVWIAAIASLTAAVALSVLLGAGLVMAHLLLLASAWAYNLGLKAKAVSLLPFLIGFGVFPSFATLSAPEPQLAAWWAWVAGAALGSAVHLTNVLPDLDDDARTGIRGLPHRLGLRGSASSAAAALLTGAAAVTLGSTGTEDSAVVLSAVSLSSWLLTGVILLLSAFTVILAWRGFSGRVLFRLVMAAALVMALQLVLAGGSAGLDGSGDVGSVL